MVTRCGSCSRTAHPIILERLWQPPPYHTIHRRRIPMQYRVEHCPSYALAIVRLDPGEQLRAEPGAMVSMSANVQIDTGVQGGLMAGLKRSLLGGESFFMNTFTAPQGGEVTLAPSLP